MSPCGGGAKALIFADSLEMVDGVRRLLPVLLGSNVWGYDMGCAFRVYDFSQWGQVQGSGGCRCCGGVGGVVGRWLPGFLYYTVFYSLFSFTGSTLNISI